MATISAMNVVLVNSSNKVIESNGAAGSATRQSNANVRVVNSSGTVIVPGTGS